jgi:ribosome biogenesis GTPase / thiamine phosphate phosphatase
MSELREYDGRVIKSFGRRFVVSTLDGTFDCELRGRFRSGGSRATAPVVAGDRVTISVEQPPYGTIETLLPRQNKISRPDVAHPGREQIIVANCDQLVVVTSVAQPKIKPRAIDRFLMSAERNAMDGVVVINKIDLATTDTHERVAKIYELIGYRVVLTSIVAGLGIDRLREIVQLKTSLFVGHSGVGKSSLLNALQPGLALATGAISDATGLGVHTTITVELHPLEFGGYIVDTPGLRVISLWEATIEELPDLFREFVPHQGQCRFRQCMHIGEPGCKVIEAVGKGDIAPERYESYRRIRQSLIDEKAH